ncbi:MAG: ArdC family protein [Hyphomonadaceae bacterium]
MKRSTQTKQVEPKRSAFDALAHVTAEISNMLERGVMPWRAPWDNAKALALTPGLPLRSNGAPYRGANVMLLWAAQIARGHSKRTWLTFRQALELGGHVRKGEKACPVIYYGQAKPKPDDAGKNADDDRGDAARAYRFLKLFYVFNVDQIDELPEGFGAEVVPAAAEPGAIEQWTAQAGIRVRIGGSMACYAPVTDLVHMPAHEAFLSEEHWAATLLHESVHFTGHKSRLDRLDNYATDRKARAREELCAEFGSAILGAMAGLAPFHLEDHASYIANWLELLRDEPRAFLAAGARAQAAVDWLLQKAGSLPAGSD